MAHLTSCSYPDLTMTSVLTITIHNVFLISKRTLPENFIYYQFYMLLILLLLLFFLTMHKCVLLPTMNVH